MSLDNLRHAQYRPDGTQIDNPGDIIALTAAQVAALQSAAARKTISQLVAGGVFHIAHDGAGQYECESYSPRAYRAGAVYGYGGEPIIPDGPNWRTTSDGALIDAHVDDLASLVNGAAWSTGTGNATAQTLLGSKTVNLKGSATYPFGGQDSAGMVDLDAFQRAVGGQWPHAPEPKTLAGAQATMREYALAGLQDYSLVNFAGSVAAYTTLAPQLRRAGFTHVGYILSAGEHATFSTATAQAMLAAGVNWVVIDRTQAAAVANAATAAAAGMYVMVWNMWRRSHMVPFAAGTVHCWTSESPKYTSASTTACNQLRTNFISGTPGIGAIPKNDTNNTNGRGQPSPSTSGYWRWVSASASGPRSILLGSMVPTGDMPTSYTITVPITVVSRGTATERRWGLQFGIGTTDEGMDAETAGAGNLFTGWVIQIRNSNAADGTGSNGDLRFRTVTAGGVLGTVQAQALSGLVTDGMTLTLTIQVTPTQIIAALTGGVTGTLIVNDTTSRGKYPSIGLMGGTDAATWDHGDVIRS